MFRIPFRVSVGFHCGGLLPGNLARISLGFLSPRVSLVFHLGYKQEGIKQKIVNSKKAVKTESKQVGEQEIEQQKHVNEKKKVKL